MKPLLAFLFLPAMLLADPQAGGNAPSGSSSSGAVMESLFASRDVALQTDPAAAFWRNAPVAIAENGPVGEPAAGHRTEVRSRYTATHLYFLFTCPYHALYLLPEANRKQETNKLWERDVAEVFIGSDFEKIWRYREFQVSPQGEFVDLDIDRKQPLPEGGWKWNSGFSVAARIDEKNKVWYGAFKIPLASLVEPGQPAPQSGQEFRMNFYRLQGPPRPGAKPSRVMVAWQPTGAPNYHVPEAFGRLRLAPASRTNSGK